MFCGFCVSLFLFFWKLFFFFSGQKFTKFKFLIVAVRSESLYLYWGEQETRLWIDNRTAAEKRCDSLTVRCFLLWHFERVQSMESRWISAMGCGRLLGRGFVSHLISQSPSAMMKKIVSMKLQSLLVDFRCFYNSLQVQPHSMSVSRCLQCYFGCCECEFSHWHAEILALRYRDSSGWRYCSDDVWWSAGRQKIISRH